MTKEEIDRIMSDWRNNIIDGDGAVRTLEDRLFRIDEDPKYVKECILLNKALTEIWDDDEAPIFLGTYPDPAIAGHFQEVLRAIFTNIEFTEKDGNIYAPDWVKKSPYLEKLKGVAEGYAQADKILKGLKQGNGKIQTDI